MQRCRNAQREHLTTEPAAAYDSAERLEALTTRLDRIGDREAAFGLGIHAISSNPVLTAPCRVSDHHGQPSSGKNWA